MTKDQQISYCLDTEQFRDAFCAYAGQARKLMLVHGRKSYRSCGAQTLIEGFLSESLSEVVEFMDFTENPKKEDVNAGVAILTKSHPDFIVAVGGGSAMDMAKLIRFYAPDRLPLMAIPTTAGTGAESTQFAVCYIDGVKHSISDPDILPDCVILYPPFTYRNSRYLTSCTGFDALAQAVEAYWNIHSTEESDKYALRAIQYIHPLLIKETLSDHERSELLLDANYAGKAINITRTTVPHALSYTLTSRYGYPHGHAVALTFPFFLKYNLNGDVNAYRGEDFEEYAFKMDQLRDLLNLGSDAYASMKEYIKLIGLGFDPDREFDDMAVAQGLNLERAGNTPIAVNEAVILSAIQSIRE